MHFACFILTAPIVSLTRCPNLFTKWLMVACCNWNICEHYIHCCMQLGHTSSSSSVHDAHRASINGVSRNSLHWIFSYWSTTHISDITHTRLSQILVVAVKSPTLLCSLYLSVCMALRIVCVRAKGTDKLTSGIACPRLKLWCVWVAILRVNSKRIAHQLMV